MVKKRLGFILLKIQFYLQDKIQSFSIKNILAYNNKAKFKVFVFSTICLFFNIILYFLKINKLNKFSSKKYKFPELLENRTITIFKKIVGLQIREPQNLLYNLVDESEILKYKLEFPVIKNPKISIIIPVYNKVSYTFNCLLSLINCIHNNETLPSLEIIVVNDCSTDTTGLFLNQTKNIIVINNKINLGFLENCNLGAKHAQGEYILLLNNDIQVNEDFLSPLLNVFSQFSEVGAVGGKLIYPSGLLQEAGGYIFKNSFAANYGRNSNPNWWQFNHIKEVDYCSGALLMVKKHDWQLLNGLDKVFAPCYYEDTDICTSIKYGLNKKVYYTPLSSIYHFEGVTSGVDESAGSKRFQTINKEKFELKWENITSTKQKINYELLKDPFFDFELNNQKSQILVVFSHIPQFDKDSGANRLTLLILEMVKYFDVYVLIDDFDINFNSNYANKFISNGVKLIYKTQDQVLQKDHINHVFKQNFAFIWLVGYYLAHKYYEQSKSTGAKIIYDTVDLHFLRLERAAYLNLIAENINEIKTNELNYIQKADLSLFVSDIELNIIEKMNIGNNKLLSNIHLATNNFGLNYNQRKDLLFIGGFHHEPNIDAVIWLKNEIMPIVWENNPTIKVNIIGSNAPKAILDLASDKFIIHGFVQDVSPLFEQSLIFICPLRFGAGVKGKIGQALEYNLPLVTTSIGAEGMHLKNNFHCIIEDSPMGLAEAILELSSNKTKWSFFQQNSANALLPFSLINVNHILKEIETLQIFKK